MSYSKSVRLPENLQKIPEQSNRCPHCGREIIRTWHYCPSCGSRTSEDVARKLSMTDTENASLMLNCLINYHERAMGFRMGDTSDRYADALRYSLMLVESCFEQEHGDTAQNDQSPINFL